jgi:hypothetical protein
MDKTTSDNFKTHYVKLTDKTIMDKLPTFKNHYVKQSIITFIFYDAFHLSKNPTSDLDKPDIPFTNLNNLYTSITNFDKLTKSKNSNLSETNSDLSTFDKQLSKTISTFDNLSEYDKTIIDGTIYDEKTTSKNLSTFDNLSETYYEPLNPDKDKQVKQSKRQTTKDNKAKKSISKNKQKQKSLSKKPKKNLNGGGFTREARIMALLLGYEKDQMGRAIRTISECISYFSEKTYNLEAAIYRTFAVYLYIAQKSGWKKVFIPPEALPRFEDESLKQMDKVAWGYLLRYKEKYNLQQKRQKQKQQKHKQKKLL